MGEPIVSSYIKVFFLLVIFVFCLFNLPFTIIGAGERGVVMDFGKVSNNVLGEGLNFKMPFVQSVKTISVRVQKDDIKLDAASRDLQDVTVDAVVNYHINPAGVNKVYQRVGDNKDVFERIISPNTNEVIKASTAQFTAEDIIKKRQELKQVIDVRLAERLRDYDVILDDVSLVNIDFSQEFNAAIEAKQVAEQQSQQARFTAERAVKEAEAIVNKAKGDAESQRLQQQSLSPELLQKMWIDKWNGSVPTVVSGENQLLFQLPK